MLSVATLLDATRLRFDVGNARPIQPKLARIIHELRVIESSALTNFRHFGTFTARRKTNLYGQTHRKMGAQSHRSKGLTPHDSGIARFAGSRVYARDCSHAHCACECDSL